MTTCPVCNKSVDPLRSRFVAVVGGKVIAYCSAECAGRPAVEVPRAAAPEGPPADSPSTGVPTRIATPVSGVPARRTPAGGSPADPPRPVTPPPGVPISTDSGPVIEILHEPASGVVTSARDERTARAKHPDEISMAVFWSADKEASRGTGDPGSAPVKAVAAERTARGEGAAASSARDDTLDRWATDEAERSGARASSESEHASRGNRVRIVGLVLLLLVAGGVYVYVYVLKDGVAGATTPRASAPAPAARREPTTANAKVEPPVGDVRSESGEEARPVLIDAAAAVAHARATLTAHLSATSPRLQRLAAAALARTQDPGARDVLAAHIGLGARADPADISELARLDLAYALARGGDPRGSEALAGALGSRRGELRDEAARLLALLGDSRAAPHLIDLLAVSQRRLGAAEHLAHLAEPHAVKVLQQLLADARATADDKARAAIALGIARHAEVAPALRGMLGDPHFNAFAAAALAELEDRAARPILEHQLDSPSLRVRAARALRRLDPALDAAPVLGHLLDVLQRGRDTDQVAAAEAILLLAGPPAWAAYE